MTAEQFAPWPEPQHVRDLRAQVARVKALADEWERQCDAIAITYQDATARSAATIALRRRIAQLRAALDGDQ